LFCLWGLIVGSWWLWVAFLSLFSLGPRMDPTISQVALDGFISCLPFPILFQKNLFPLSTKGDSGGIGGLLFLEWLLGVLFGPFPAFFLILQQSSGLAWLTSTSFCLLLLFGKCYPLSTFFGGLLLDFLFENLVLHPFHFDWSPGNSC
jgi:hypothetical protein